VGRAYFWVVRGHVLGGPCQLLGGQGPYPGWARVRSTFQVLSHFRMDQCQILSGPLCGPGSKGPLSLQGWLLGGVLCSPGVHGVLGGHDEPFKGSIINILKFFLFRFFCAKAILIYIKWPVLFLSDLNVALGPFRGIIFGIVLGPFRDIFFGIVLGLFRGIIFWDSII